MADVRAPRARPPRRGPRRSPACPRGEPLREDAHRRLISALEGARLVVAVPGCVGTTFQSSTSSLEAELGENAMDDRRRRLGRARRRRQLTLRREREARHAGAAVPGRLSDEQDRRLGAGDEVGREAGAEEVRARAARRTGCTSRRSGRAQARRTNASSRPTMPRAAILGRWGRSSAVGSSSTAASRGCGSARAPRRRADGARRRGRGYGTAADGTVEAELEGADGRRRGACRLRSGTARAPRGSSASS